MTDTPSPPDSIRIGFLPLVDSAVLITAREQGFAAAEGIDLQLIRETSWANIRDKVVHRRLDAAHMLAGLSIATTLGLAGPPTAMVAPFSLGLNGNAITLAERHAALLEAEATIDDPAGAAQALARLIGTRRASGQTPLRFGIVHGFSSHNYILRYWLASAGIDPERDVELVVVPPPFMVDTLAREAIDGFCVGEPWNSAAVAAGIGRIIAFGCRIWQRGVEKVLGCRADWAEANGERLGRLLRALDAAAHWAGDRTNHDALASLLATPTYLDKPAELIRHSLSGRLPIGPEDDSADASDFLLLYRNAANFPWVSQALWLYSQMVRWGQAPLSDDTERQVRAVFRPDLYRRALVASDTPVPGASAKVEGALDQPLDVGSRIGRLSLGPDRFFDGRVFDPERLHDYIRSFDRQPTEENA